MRSTYGLGVLIGSGNAYGVCLGEPVSRPLGVWFPGGLFTDVAWGRPGRLRRGFRRTSFTLIASALLGSTQRPAAPNRAAARRAAPRLPGSLLATYGFIIGTVALNVTAAHGWADAVAHALAPVSYAVLVRVAAGCR